MDINTLKQRILEGNMTDEELSALFENKSSHSNSNKPGGTFLKTILKGFLEGYTAPNMWRLTLEAILIFSVVVGVVILSNTGRIDAAMTSVLMAFVLGFLFGKIK